MLSCILDRGLSPVSMAAPSGALTAAAAGTLAQLPSCCLEAILALLPPNAIPLGMRQLNKEWRQRYLQQTTVSVSGDGHLPAWAVLEVLPHTYGSQRLCMMPALARRGALAGMQELARHLLRYSDGLRTHSDRAAVRAAAGLGRVDMVQWLLLPHPRSDGLPVHCVIGMEVEASCAAAAAGHVHLLEWLRTYDARSVYSSSTPYAATRAGRLDVMQWLRANGCVEGWDVWLMQSVAGAGHLALLQALRAQGCAWDADIKCYSAARGGRLEVLQYLHRAGCTLGDDICVGAACGGSVEVLKYVRAHGAPWSIEEVVAAAADAGAVAMLQYLAAEGAVLDRHIMHRTIKGDGGLEAVRWLHEQGCPWDARSCKLAVKEGKLDMLLYLLQHGCPHASCSDLCAAAAARPQREVLVSSAAAARQKELLLWLREHGHAWTASVCKAAAACGNLQLLQWLRGCTPPSPWGSSTVHMGVHHFSSDGMSCLQYALSNGCPWDESDRAAAKKKHGRLRSITFHEREQDS